MYFFVSSLKWTLSLFIPVLIFSKLSVSLCLYLSFSLSHVFYLVIIFFFYQTFFILTFIKLKIFRLTTESWDTKNNYYNSFTKIRQNCKSTFPSSNKKKWLHRYLQFHPLNSLMRKRWNDKRLKRLITFSFFMSRTSEAKPNFLKKILSVFYSSRI